MATPHLDRNMAAQLLVEAAFESDAIVAHRHGKTTRSIRSYRDRLSSDPELEKLFQQKVRIYEKDWGHKLSSVMINGLDALNALHKSAVKISERIEDCKLDPEMVNSLSKLMGTLSDSLKDMAQVGLTREVISARIAATNRTNGKETIPTTTQAGYVIDSEIYERNP